MYPRITVVALGVYDLARSRRFYCDGLGWRPSSQSDNDIVFIDAGGIVLELYLHEALAADAGLDPKGGGFGGIVLARNVASAAEVDLVVGIAERAGATILKAPQPASWGGYSGYFSDPDAHPWEITYNPMWGFDSAGAVVLPE